MIASKFMSAPKAPANTAKCDSTGFCMIAQLGDVLGDWVAVEEWHRGAAVVDEITGAKPQ